MRKSELERRLAALEARVADLESRPQAFVDGDRLMLMQPVSAEQIAENGDADGGGKDDEADPA